MTWNDIRALCPFLGGAGLVALAGFGGWVIALIAVASMLIGGGVLLLVVLMLRGKGPFTIKFGRWEIDAKQNKSDK